jgi:uncharacterized protein (DUF1330 family)
LFSQTLLVLPSTFFAKHLLVNINFLLVESHLMSAYIIVDTRITDPQAYEAYKQLAKPIAEKFGGIYRARGGAMDVRETDLWSPTRVVIIEFPSMQAAQAFVDSKEYAPVKPLRTENAQCTLLLLEGC